MQSATQTQLWGARYYGASHVLQRQRMGYRRMGGAATQTGRRFNTMHYTELHMQRKATCNAKPHSGGGVLRCLVLQQLRGGCMQQRVRTRGDDLWTVHRSPAANRRGVW